MGKIRVEWRVQRGELGQSDFIKIHSNSTRDMANKYLSQQVSLVLLFLPPTYNAR